MNKRRKRVLAVVVVVLLVLAAGAYHYRGRIANKIARMTGADAVAATTIPSVPDDAFDVYGISSLEFSEQSDELAQPTRPVRRAAELGIDWDTMRGQGAALVSLRQSILAEVNGVTPPADAATFEGTTSDELQSFVNDNRGKAIRLSSKEISLTSPVVLPSDTYLIGEGTRVTCEGGEQAFVAQNASRILLDGLTLMGGTDGSASQYGVYLAGCDHVVLQNLDISGLASKPIVVGPGCTDFAVRQCSLHDNDEGGIYLFGDSSRGLVASNTIEGNKGNSNWMAGIVLTSVDSSDPMDPWKGLDQYRFFATQTDISQELEAPNNLVVSNNTVEGNDSSGIYSDGAYLGYFVGNHVSHNQKEGMCLDYGTVGCYVFGNRFEANGHRGNQSDQALTLDGVADFGRMPDGSAVSKLPGISIDNAAYNTIEGNTVEGNYGGGVKTVRTGVRNVIAANRIVDNNMGASDQFHFFGIELGNAGFGEQAPDLDYVGDYENVVVQNTISGNHYSGVFLGEEARDNYILRNAVQGPDFFAVESISRGNNAIEGTVSDRDSRIA